MSASDKPRPSIRMTPEVAWATLEASHTGIFTTLRRDGWPIALPVWFVTLNRRVFLSTPAGSKKLVRIAHDPRSSFLVESGERWAELTAVHLTGTAAVMPEDDAVAPQVHALIGQKYDAFRTARAAMPAETAAAYEKRPSFTLIEFTPDARILSWDNAALGLS